jgi:hypothetical protein
MDNGHQVCGDVLPQCYGKGYREVSPQGTVRRLVEAPLTPNSWPAARPKSAPGAGAAGAPSSAATSRCSRPTPAWPTSKPAATGRSKRRRPGAQAAEARQAQLIKKRESLNREAEFYQAPDAVAAGGGPARSPTASWPPRGR